MLEAGIAIAVCALTDLEDCLGPVFRIQADDSGDYVLRLHAVRAYVLHRGRSDLAGDQGEILHPPEAVTRHIRDQVVENHARTHGQQHLVQPHVHILDELYVGMQDGSGEVLGKQQVAAGAHVENGLRQGLQVQALQLLHAVVLYIQRRLHLHPEGVLGGQVVVLYSFHTNCSSAKNSGR